MTTSKGERAGFVRTVKKIVPEPVLFIVGEKASGNSPRLPHIPPQLHHKNTTLCTRFSLKSPAKTAFHQRRQKARETTVAPTSD
jgi:ABC-type phosphonate transport system ATPase subunit